MVLWEFLHYLALMMPLILRLLNLLFRPNTSWFCYSCFHLSPSPWILESPLEDLCQMMVSADLQRNQNGPSW